MVQIGDIMEEALKHPGITPEAASKVNALQAELAANPGAYKRESAKTAFLAELVNAIGAFVFTTTKQGLKLQQKQQQRVLDKAGQLNELKQAIHASDLHEPVVLAHLCQQCPEDVMEPCNISAALNLLGYKETMQALDELVSNTYDPSVSVDDIIRQSVDDDPQLRGALNEIVHSFLKTDMSSDHKRKFVRDLIGKVGQEAWNITKTECRKRKRAQNVQMNARLRAQQQQELARDERMRRRTPNDDDDAGQSECLDALSAKENETERLHMQKQRVGAAVSRLPRSTSVICGGITQAELTPQQDEEDQRMLAECDQFPRKRAKTELN